ncbi:MAG: glycine--tRNA ligase [Candidatus Daviesbacteria bacterium]|nr:glycine--tRNA ligase [Candidatus Daviesbacteria bacterium]
MEDNLLQKVVSLCKRRGFIYPGSEIYGGLSNSWDYGPLGVELKNNIKQLWWKRFVHQREDIVGIDAALIMNPKVWEASGHLENFTDVMVECKKCHSRFRADQLDNVTLIKDNERQVYQIGSETECPNCSSKGEMNWTKPSSFNLMFKTFIGPAEESANIAYFRPETAQAMFVDFKNVLDTSRKKLPFGIAQVGKAFRNEITPGNFIFRTREFEQMEIEYFIAPPKSDEEWQKVFEDWRQAMVSWMKDDLKLDLKKVHEVEIPNGERAHYSKRTIDFEFDFPFGTKELYGLAYRGDFDLKNHEQASRQSTKYKDPETQDEFWPHVIEPTWGVDRSVLAVLVNSYEEVDGKVKLKLPAKLAPYKAAVFPLLANKPPLVDLAKKIYLDLKENFMVAWDERGNIGGRYAAQDEVGTPFCVTVDFQSLEDKTVTVRERDSALQDRVKIDILPGYLQKKING